MTLVQGTDIIISSENVHKTYLLGVEGVAALRGVSVDVARGELLVVYGTSGGGKSTLLNVLGTIDVPTKGNLALFEHRITDRTPDSDLAEIRNRKVGFVFQSFNLLPTMTALANVELPMIIAGALSGAEITARATKLLNDVGLGHRIEHYPGQLSGGEQQRVTIARALANDPDVLLLDEPTGDLDTRNTHLVLDILFSLNVTKTLTMVMVTHDVYMKQYAHRVLHLRDGKVARCESIDAASRDAARKELKATVEAEQEQLRSGRTAQGGTGEPRTTRRTARSYATYTSSASGESFYQHENPGLFQRLFPVQTAVVAGDQRGDINGEIPTERGGAIVSQQPSQQGSPAPPRTTAASNSTSASLRSPDDDTDGIAPKRHSAGPQPAPARQSTGTTRYDVANGAERREGPPQPLPGQTTSVGDATLAAPLETSTGSPGDDAHRPPPPASASSGSSGRTNPHVGRQANHPGGGGLVLEEEMQEVRR